MWMKVRGDQKHVKRCLGISVVEIRMPATSADQLRKERGPTEVHHTKRGRHNANTKKGKSKAIGLDCVPMLRWGG